MRIIKFLWLLSIVTIPLLMLRYYRFGDIPLTNLFLIIAGIIYLPSILKEGIGKIEKSFYLLFGIFLLISIFDLMRSIDSEITYFYEIKIFILLLTLKLYSFFMSKFKLDFFLKYLTLSSGVALIFLLFRSLFIYNAPFFVVDPQEITEVGKNQVAFYLALVIPCIFWYLKKYNLSFLMKAVVIASLMIHVFAAIYVQSRGVLLSLGLAFVVTLFFYDKIKFNVGTVLKTALISVVPLYFLFSSSIIDLEEFAEEIEGIFTSDVTKNSTSSREALINESLNYFYDNPFIGIGTNNFSRIEGKPTHNTYLQFLAENGIIGFFIFLFFFGRINYQLVTLKSEIPSYLLAVNVMLSLLTYLMVINGFFNAITAVVLAIIIFHEKEEQRKTKQLQI